VVTARDFAGTWRGDYDSEHGWSGPLLVDAIYISETRCQTRWTFSGLWDPPGVTIVEQDGRVYTEGPGGLTFDPDIVGLITPRSGEMTGEMYFGVQRKVVVWRARKVP